MSKMMRIHFNKVSGYFPWGRGFGQGVNWRNAIFDTSNPLLIDAALRDLAGPKKYVEALAEAKAQDEPPVVTPEPKAEIRCNHCGEFFPEPAYTEHRKTIGRNTEPAPKVAERRRYPGRAVPRPVTARR